MKKSKIISLALITAALASCHKETQPTPKKVYLRSDTTADYAPAYVNNDYWLWYYAFRPYGYYTGGMYSRTGYYSSGISERANIGHSSTKSGIVRGGFGGKGFSVSS